MPRTTLTLLVPALAAFALAACGTDDSKSTTTTTPSKTSATDTQPAETPKPPAVEDTTRPDATKPDMTRPDSTKTDPAATADATKPADASKPDMDSTPKPDGAKPAEAAGDKPPVVKESDAALSTMREFIASKKIDTSAAGWRTGVPMPPKLAFDPARTYFWVMSTTEGPIKIRLMPDVAPMHVSSTIYLTQLGFYDGLKFHRVIPGFMAQGGDPLGTGTGGPAYKYAGELSPTVKHDKPGMLSMANAGPNTDGSQFFLTFVPTPHLDGRHTIFGQVVEGLDTLKKLESFGSGNGATSKLLKIDTASIVVE